jgi:hypothetical protein
MNQIRNLHIYYDLDYRGGLHDSALKDLIQDDWVRTWAVLGSMTGLRRLHITFVCYMPQVLGEFEMLWTPLFTEVLKPVGTITAPNDFIIRLPDRRYLTDFDVGDSNCVLKLLDARVDTDDRPI